MNSRDRPKTAHFLSWPSRLLLAALLLVYPHRDARARSPGQVEAESCPSQANFPASLPAGTNDLIQALDPVGGDNEELNTLSGRAEDFKATADLQASQARLAREELSQPGNCGGKWTFAECLKKEIAAERDKLPLLSEEARARSDERIEELQSRLDLPDTLESSATNARQASAVLDEMIQTHDFSFKKHFGIIGKALLNSWSELVAPGPIIAVSSGLSGYALARATSLNKEGTAFGLEHPRPKAIRVLADQINSVYPVLAPFFIAGAVAKNEKAMQTADALIAGTAISSAVVFPLKYLVREARPNGADNLGFPSGHSAQSFMMATVLDQQYPEKHHLVGMAAYAVAGLVGFSRVQGTNHTVGQVSAGAGIGIATGLAAIRSVRKAEKTLTLTQALTGTFRIHGKTLQCRPLLGRGFGGTCIVQR